MSRRHYKIGLISLGCSKNLVDAENLVSMLIAKGYETADDYHEADLVIVNTCGFINDAIQESLDTIQDAMIEHGKVIVTGCLGKNKALLSKAFPDLLHMGGPGEHDEILKVVQHYFPLQHTCDSNVDSLIKLTPSHYGYLKIAEGCNHRCSYCIIPKLRGSLVSRPMEAILQEASQLKAQGVKELLVIAQDTAAYAHDRGEKKAIVKLCRELGQLDLWVRLHYLYPYGYLGELVELMQDRIILPYLDVPLQHCNPRLLKQMRRPGHTDHLLQQIETWRAICPDVAIRSTFIVGFPGETEAEFEELLTFLEDAKLDRVGCFAYSDVEGAAANGFSHHLPEEVKASRLELLMDLQRKISAEKLAQKIGATMNVIVDEVHDDHMIGRTEYDAPEIDGRVIINQPDDGKITPGNIISVKITDSDEYDLFV